jgi:hypothetical protein
MSYYRQPVLLVGGSCCSGCLDIEITGRLGVCTDPQHMIAYADGEVRQERLSGASAQLAESRTDRRRR